MLRIERLSVLWQVNPLRLNFGKFYLSPMSRNKISHVKEKISMEWEMEKIRRMDRHKIDATKY